MDDNFLYQNRPPVRSGFGERLYSRISDLPLQKRNAGNVLRFALRSVVVSTILFTVLFSVSQPVRASVLHWLKDVAGFVIEERDSMPAGIDTVLVPPDYRGNSMDEVIDHLPYELSMPSYMPDGFIFEDKVDVKDASVFMSWKNPDGDEILMLVDTDHGQRYLTGTDAGQEIQVNGQPALLVQGNYDANGNWDSEQKMMNLIQRRDEVIYWFIYVGDSEGGFDNGAVQEELVRMMGSLKK